MSYNLHFVGLVCFTRFVAGLDALLPDGRNFGARHFPAIVSAPGAALEADWWGSDDEHDGGVFRIDNDPGPLPPQSIA